MLFKWSSTEEELATEFEKSIDNRYEEILTESIEIVRNSYNNKIVEIIGCLNKAAENLEQFNLIKESVAITKLADAIVDSYSKEEKLEDEFLDEILGTLENSDSVTID